MVGAEHPSDLRGVDQFPVIGSVAGTEGVQLLVGRDMPSAGRHDCRVEAPTQGNADPLVRLGLATQCFQED
jgi:hypothetical protein